MGLVTLLLCSGPKLAVGSEELGDQVCLGHLAAVGGNFVFCLMIVVIFIGLGRAYKLGVGDCEVIKWEARQKGEVFYGKVDPSRHHVKILVWQL